VIYLWRVVLLIVAASLGWRVTVNGIAGFYVDKMDAGDDGAIDQVLTWQPDNPAALYRKALREPLDDPAQGAKLLSEAYRGNPSDPRALVALASQAFAAKQFSRSDELIEIASALAPADARVQKQVASYWAARGQPDRAIKHLSSVLLAAPLEARTILPALIEIAADPERQYLLAPLASSPPKWWGKFFAQACRDIKHLDSLRYLYNLRRDSGTEPLTSEERAAFVARLQRDGQISEAYMVGINGLDMPALKQLGLVFNGGFELPLSNAGFGWHLVPNERVSARLLASTGTTGNQALNLKFRALEQPFRHLFQPLFLDPGHYRITGRTRTDGLKSIGGVRWEVRCEQPESQVLAEGPRLLASSDWTNFEFESDIPEACHYQQLRLVSAGTRRFEVAMAGTIWFDDMRITRVKDTAAVAETTAGAVKSGPKPDQILRVGASSR